MRNKKENSTITPDLKLLSENFLTARQESWDIYNRGENVKESNSLQKEFQRQLNFIFEKLSKGKFDSESDNLLAKFILMFGKESLDQEKLSLVKDFLEERKRDYPILLKTEQIIMEIKDHITDFFVSYGSNFHEKHEVFYLAKTGNKLADIIIKTEIKRFIIHQNADPSLKKTQVNFLTTLKEADDKLEITLKK